MPLTILLAQIQEMTEQSASNPNGCVVDGVPTLKCLEVVFGNIIVMSAAFVLLILFIMFIIGGFTYLTSFGNPEKVKKAQGTLTYAFLGLGLYLISFLILKVIDIIFLGGNNDIFRLQIPSQ